MSMRKMPLASMFAMAGALASSVGIPMPDLPTSNSVKVSGFLPDPPPQQFLFTCSFKPRGTPGCERSSKRRQRRMRAKARKLAK